LPDLRRAQLTRTLREVALALGPWGGGEPPFFLCARPRNDRGPITRFITPGHGGDYTKGATTRLEKWLQEWQERGDPLLENLEGFEAYVREKSWWSDVQVVDGEVLQPYESDWAKAISEVLNKMAPTRTETVWRGEERETGKSCLDPLLVGEWVAPNRDKLEEGIRGASSLAEPFIPGKPAYKVVSGTRKVDILAFNTPAPIGLLDSCQVSPEKWDSGGVVPKVLSQIQTQAKDVESKDLLSYLEFIHHLSGRDRELVMVRIEAALKGADGALYLRTLAKMGSDYTTTGRRLVREIYVEAEAASQEIFGKMGIGQAYDAERLLILKPLLKHVSMVDLGFGEKIPLVVRFQDRDGEFEVLYMMGPYVPDEGELAFMGRYFAQREYKLGERMVECEECGDEVPEKDLKVLGPEAAGFDLEGEKVCPTCYESIQKDIREEAQAEAEAAKA